MRPRISARHRRLISLIIVSSLLFSFAAFSPSSDASTRERSGIATSVSGGLGSIIASRVSGVFSLILALFQGGGGSSVPGTGLPDLNAARQTQASDPAAPDAIASTLACTDCTPCPTCGPGTANHAPVVNAGGPYYGTAGTVVVISGLGSFDVDSGDGISDYAWSFGDNTAIVHGALPSHTYQSAGNYTVSLTVTDRHSSTASATVTASISAPPASVPPSGSAQGNAAQFISQSLPTTMTAGQHYQVTVTMRNTGSSVWSAAHLYRLGSQNPQDNGNWGTGRVYLPASVAPGTDVTFNFTVVAPCSGCEENTTANFRWRMVQDGVQWFGDLTPNQGVTIISNYEPPHNGGWFPGPISDLFNARIAPQNRTGASGEDLLSGNFNWGLGLANLAGRAGLNLSLPLSYNSLAAWTKVVPPPSYLPPPWQQPTSWTFDADRGFPSVGFRLGFPTIQGPFSNNQTGDAYLMLMPSGARVELRRVGATNVYEAADSSYLQLIDGGNGSLMVRTTEGSQLAYWSINSEYRCTEIKDRNGNYVTIKYDPINGVANLGRMTSVIDTLGRTLYFNYDAKYRLQSISQLRNGQAHLWATFGYRALTIETNFVESAGEGDEEEGGGPRPAVVGLPEDHVVSVLTQVGLDDGSRYNFDYTSWGQVYRVKHLAADGHQLNYISYNLPLDSSTEQSDCPRFTQKQEWAENWNNNSPATTTFQSDPYGTWNQVTSPDGTAYREYATTDYTDWKRGLVTKTEVYSSDNTSTPKKTTTTDWTQDPGSANCPLNPRPYATTISDSDGNRRRTSIDYTAFGLPLDVFEMGPSGSSDWVFLRRTHTDYDLSETYVRRHIIGLVTGQYVFAPDAPTSPSTQVLMSKSTSEYDVDTGICTGLCATYATEANSNSIVQHDNANFGSGFVVGRGLLTRVRRWDVTDEMSGAKARASSIHYNVLGCVIRTSDPLGHEATIGYTDSFSNDGINGTTAPYVTLAYPTTVTDADGYSAIAKYHYDLGVSTRQQDPKGAAKTTQYDAAGRVKQITNSVNGAYTRFLYPGSQTIVVTATTVNDLTSANEAFSFAVFDGAGRTRATASDFPNSTGHYSGSYTGFDVMGRAVANSNPTEMTGNWTASGDDTNGWRSTTQTYDWKGRPLVSTHPSITGNPSETTTMEATYGGCGCAGGEVVTLKDEGTIVNGVLKRRVQRAFTDALGRNSKTEILNWDGSIYATSANAYNARDQITLVRQHQGADSSNVHQDTTMTYDGYGRLKTKHLPEQQADANNVASSDHTTWNYFADDTIQQIIDPRGVIMNMGFNARHLVESVSYDSSNVTGGTGVPQTPPVSFAYDVAGNRTLMADGIGTTTYAYDELSQMTSETHTITELARSYTLAYDYTVSGKLRAVTDAANATITYGYDQIGRLREVNGSGFGSVTQYGTGMEYRAWGALKQIYFGSGANQKTSVTFNPRMQVDRFEIRYANTNAVQASEQFQYMPDGRVSSSSDSVLSSQDRSYQYDQTGSIVQALTGEEARGQTVTAPNEIPFNQNYAHDVWDNLTSRTGKFWGNTMPAVTESYVSNRNTAWAYDAAGHVVQEGSRHFTYDAAGTNVSVTDPPRRVNQPGLSQTQVYDGDGRRVKRVENGSTVYELHAAALGGALVTTLNAQGNKSKGHVYANGNLLATQDQTTGIVTWVQHSPGGTGDWNAFSNAPNTIRDIELDPLMNDVGTENPNVTGGSGGGGGDGQSYPGLGDPEAPQSCALNYDILPCEYVYKVLRRSPQQTLFAIIKTRIGNYGVLMDRQVFDDNSIVRDVNYDYTIGPDGKMVHGPSMTVAATPGVLESIESVHSIMAMSVTLESRPQNSGANPFPTFSKDNLKVVQDSIKLAQEMTKDKKCDEALKAYGIPSLAALVNGMTPNGNVFDGRTSTLTGPIGKNGATESMAAYFKENKTSVGAAVFPNSVTGRGSVTFLGNYFFNPASMDWVAFQRAIIMLHESVHQVGQKGDAPFGTSKELSEKIIEKCYPVLKGKLGGVG